MAARISLTVMPAFVCANTDEESFRNFDTDPRAQKLKEFARSVDRVIFVCGRKSSNGKVLFEACRQANPESYNIEEPQEIRAEWLAGARTVGICGATSTPKWLMQATADYVKTKSEG